MKNRKMLFLDLDGTLLNDEKKISNYNRAAIRKMLDAGHYCVIATGRPIASAILVVKDLGLTMPGCYMLAYNGAVIYDCSADCILTEKKLPIEYVEYLFDEAEKAGLYIHTYSQTHILTQKNSRELQLYADMSKMPYKLADNIFDILETEPNKLLLVSLDDSAPLEKFQKEHLKWEKNKCISFFSDDKYLEYCPLKVDKGSGILFLSHFLNISIENTVAVGDERNDISMIKKAHIGIAMKNGREELKKAADFITELDNNHHAIAQIIETYILG